VVSSIAERVAAGAAFLDEHEPGWAARIDLDRLALEDCQDCVLGQILGSFDDGLLDLNLEDPGAIELGFMEPGLFLIDTNYPDLTAEWKRVITERRAAA
jgi:hypothetical protein